MTTRRDFITKMSAAFGYLALNSIPCETKNRETARGVVRFGVISDIHRDLQTDAGKRWIRIFLLSFASVFCLAGCQIPLNTRCDIIPAPQQVSFGRGYFKINANTHIQYTDTAMKAEAEKMQVYLANITGQDVTTTDAPDLQKNVIVLETSEGMDAEAYQLTISAKRIICRASTLDGLFYAIQSLVQLTDSAGCIPCMDIVDKPRFGWRGMMLDDSRHFFGKEVIKQQLDIMARLKMNRYHWHLTDETGWRIEIKQYPELTGIGAEGNYSNRNAPRKFYTQDDVREIVAYARERHIMVIPEIDMPGHATAASRAYPEISAGGTGRWGGFTYHPARESTYAFINNVLTEVSALFPAPFIHIGGDEVHFGNQTWYTDPVIQRFIRDNKLGNEVGLEHYFVRRACEMVTRLGKTMIGWDEIIASRVTPDKAVVMWWRHDKEEQLVKALDEGFRVILTPRIPCYLDFVQDDSHIYGRRSKDASDSFDVTYRFPGNLQQYMAGREQQVLGMQASVWTERIADKKRLDFMTFPRLAIIAEDAWTDAGRKDKADFNERLKPFLRFLDSLGIYYFNLFDKDSTPEPWGPDKIDAAAEG